MRILMVNQQKVKFSNSVTKLSFTTKKAPIKELSYWSG